MRRRTILVLVAFSATGTSEVCANGTDLCTSPAFRYAFQAVATTHTGKIGLLATPATVSPYVSSRKLLVR